MKRNITNAQKAQLLALEAFSSDAFLSINKRMLSHYGPELTVYLCNLIDKLNYFIKKGMVGEDLSFFLTHSDQCEQTGMSEYQLRKCKNKLKKIGVLRTELRGVPPKEYYALDLDRMIQEFLRIKPQKIKGLNLKNFEGCTLKETKSKETILGSYEPLQPGGCNGAEGSISDEARQLIEFWGGLSHKTIRHQPGSKVFRTAGQYLDRLLNGLPIAPRSANHPSQPHQRLLAFASRYGIPSKLLDKKWTPGEIRRILTLVEQRLSDDGGRSYSLTQVLWNGFSSSHSGFSLFLFTAAKHSDPLLPEPGEEHLRMADKLAAAIGIGLPPDKRIAWAREFQSLCEEGGKDPSQVEEVLDWYRDNYDYPRVRSVVDAQEFADYYHRIRKSMLIQLEEQQGGAGRRNCSPVQAIPTPRSKRYRADCVMVEGGAGNDEDEE